VAEQMLMGTSLTDAESHREDAVHHIGEERAGGDQAEIDRLCRRCRALVR
jgi:hypothetical protein